MELKPYQKKVVEDIGYFLDYLQKYKKSDTAFNEYWSDKIGAYDPASAKGMRPYKNNVKNCPHVCVKVPTAGGKTFIACNALKTIFDAFAFDKTKTVVWLVPSITILDQTIKNISNTSHPYRQRINTLFNGRVEVYDKNALLQASGFNPGTVREQLSILILSFDSLRSRKKEDRKIYQENGQLAPFAQTGNGTEYLMDGIEDTALIQVIRQLNPVVIVDESHNAESVLSVEMLKNLNPSFILDLTATPKDNSNIISFVDAFELKKENMVKLPVIVYNHHDTTSVFASSIELQRSLEQRAIAHEKQGGKYIRPIVLFQAQPKNASDSTTFERVKKKLLDLNIPEEQIKIKTATINEIKNMDLLSHDCPVRFIITINALKEGWDCPFAYILATLANKSSAVDVEQVVGRILRQPYVVRHSDPMLNLSFVLTSSSKFLETLDNIVKGLNRAGFSDKDYKVPDASLLDKNIETTPDSVQTAIQLDDSYDEGDMEDGAIECISEIDTDRITTLINSTEYRSETFSSIENLAIETSNEFDKNIQELKNLNTVHIPVEVQGLMNSYHINPISLEQAKNIQVPSFYKEVPSSELFDSEMGIVPLEREHLLKGFKLSTSDSQITFQSISSELYQVDIEREDSSPTFLKVDDRIKETILDYFLTLPQESQVKELSEKIFEQLSKFSYIPDKELKTYLKRIIDNLNAEQITDVYNRVYSYSGLIKNKIEELTDTFAEQKFNDSLAIDSLILKNSFSFPDTISPNKTGPSITKALYEKEGDVNTFEQKVINEVANLPNIAFWHRNLERTGFCINGFINHYPDFIVVSKSGKIIIIETKGDHLDNSDSLKKIRLGKAWANKAGSIYSYFMVFDSRQVAGAYTLNHILELLKQI